MDNQTSPSSHVIDDSQIQLQYNSARIDPLVTSNISTSPPELRKMSPEASSTSGGYVVDHNQSQFWDKSAKFDVPSPTIPTSTLPQGQPPALKTSKFYTTKPKGPLKKTRFAADSISDFPSKDTGPSRKSKPWSSQSIKSHSSFQDSDPNLVSSLETFGSGPPSHWVGATNYQTPQTIYTPIPQQPIRSHSLHSLPSHAVEFRPDFYTPLTGNISLNTPGSIPYLSHPPDTLHESQRNPTNFDLRPHYRARSAPISPVSIARRRKIFAETSDLFVAHDPFDVHADLKEKREKITFDDIDVIPSRGYWNEGELYRNPWAAVQQPWGHNQTPWPQQGSTNPPSVPSSWGQLPTPIIPFQATPHSTHSSLEPLPTSPPDLKAHEPPFGRPPSKIVPDTMPVSQSPTKRGNEQMPSGSGLISHSSPPMLEQHRPQVGETQGEESTSVVLIPAPVPSNQPSPEKSSILEEPRPQDMETKVVESATSIQIPEHDLGNHSSPEQSLASEQLPRQEEETKGDRSETSDSDSGELRPSVPVSEGGEGRHSPAGSPKRSPSPNSSTQEFPNEGEPPEDPDPNDKEGDQPPPVNLYPPIFQTYVTVIPPESRSSGPYNPYSSNDPTNLETLVYPYYYQIQTDPIEKPVVANPRKRSCFCINLTKLKNFFRWPFPRRTSHSISEFELPYYNVSDRDNKPPPKFTTDNVGKLIKTTIPHQIYLHFLLRLPSLYFSRVARIFEEAELTMREIKSMALETGLKDKGQVDLHTFESKDVPPQYTKLKSTWEAFIDSVMREWKTFNIISVLLLSAILTILQIQSAAQNPITRYAALSSLICALISLLFGCTYIIRFGTMRKTYKAAEWALEARQTRTTVWWNVWVLLAMPAIWLTWSIMLYIICIMSFVWQASASTDQNPPEQMSAKSLLAVRVIMSSVLALGILYGALILSTFRRYGQVMDNAWQRRINDWISEKRLGRRPYYGTPSRGFEQWPQTPMHNGGPSANIQPDRRRAASPPSGTPYLSTLRFPPHVPLPDDPSPRQAQFADVTSDGPPPPLHSLTSSGTGYFSDLKTVTEDPVPSSMFVPAATETEIPEDIDLEPIPSVSSFVTFVGDQLVTEFSVKPLPLSPITETSASKFTASIHDIGPLSSDDDPDSKIDAASSISGHDGMPVDSLLFSPANDNISFLTTSSTSGSAINRPGSSSSIPRSKVPW